MPDVTLILVLISLALAAVLVCIAVIDLRHHRIPDWLSMPLILCGFALVKIVPGGAIEDRLIGATAGFAVFAVIGEIYFRRAGHEGLGLGDAKLFAAAGAWLGWRALPDVLLIAALSGLAFALFRHRRSAALAFGPWLALGFWLVWVWKLFPGAI